MTAPAVLDAWTIAVQAGQLHASQRVDELAEAIRVAASVRPAVVACRRHMRTVAGLWRHAGIVIVRSGVQVRRS